METSTWIGPKEKSVEAAWPGGTALLEDLNSQQGWTAIIAASQSVTIAWQHW